MQSDSDGQTTSFISWEDQPLGMETPHSQSKELQGSPRLSQPVK